MQPPTRHALHPEDDQRTVLHVPASETASGRETDLSTNDARQGATGFGVGQMLLASTIGATAVLLIAYFFVF